MTTLAMPKPHGDRGMEGMVAKWYAANTGEVMNEYRDLAKRIANELPQGSSVLEVAPGPGYFCIELAKLGSYAITGLDISRTFVKMAAMKGKRQGLLPRSIKGRHPTCLSRAAVLIFCFAGRQPTPAWETSRF